MILNFELTFYVQKNQGQKNSAEKPISAGRL